MITILRNTLSILVIAGCTVTMATAQQPLRLKDIVPGSMGSYPGNAQIAGAQAAMIDINGTLFFAAGLHSSTGSELWKSDGTEPGTVQVKDINPGSRGSASNYFTNVNGTLFFVADDGVNGKELWKSDGTEGGTVMVKNINPNGNAFGADNGFYYGAKFTGVGNVLYFVADNGSSGRELWKSDGTETGTVMVKDIIPGTKGAFQALSEGHLFNFNGEVYFTVNSGDINTTGLWKSDGTEGGTTLLKKEVFANMFTVYNNMLFFTSGGGYSYLYKTDGTQEGTVLVKDIYIPTLLGLDYIPHMEVMNGTLYFAGAVASGTDIELWKSDGTAQGTAKVKEINPGTFGSNPMWLTSMNGMLYFQAKDGVNGAELWKSDGTEAGTVMMKDIYPGNEYSDSSPMEITRIGNALYFSALKGFQGRELWKSDGTDAGTAMVYDIPGDGNPKYLTNVNGTLFYNAADDKGQELWKMNVTTSVVESFPASKIKLFPNPSSGIINVEISADVKAEGIQITNLLGQVVFNSACTTGNNQLTPDLQAGIYIVHVITGNEKYSEKIIVR